MLSFTEKYEQRVTAVNSLLCVGLDSDLPQLPERFRNLSQPQFEFNKWIIEQTHQHASAYKPNLAFYEARGELGWQELRLTMEFLRQNYPDIPTIADAKRADIGSTNEGYVTAIFDELGFDAITLHPYLGREALQPFLDRKDKGCIILCKTSNPGSGELQDLEVKLADGEPSKKMWEMVAEKVATEWNSHNNCLLVVGATYPEELKRVRELVGEMTLLVPGIGAQGGDTHHTVQAALNTQQKGMILNSSRGIIFAAKPDLAAEQLKQEINRYR